jgi:uncharacterized membrane protein (UPF0136 family)
MSEQKPDEQDKKADEQQAEKQVEQTPASQQQQPQTEQQESVTIEVPSQANQNSQANNESKFGRLKNILLIRPVQYDIITIIFALVIFAGGVYGYLSKGSTYSLVASTIFAILLGFGAYFEGSRKNPYPLLVVLVFLEAGFAYRYFGNMKFMPSGLFALLTVIMLARNCYIIYVRRQQAAVASKTTTTSG